MDSADNFEEEMLKIDIAALAREFGIFPVLSEPQSTNKPSGIPTKTESSFCKKTGKVQFENALIALEALREWPKRDPRVCWDVKRLRVYQCKKCYKFHLGRYRGI